MIVPVVNGSDVSFSPCNAVARSNGDDAAPVISYKLNIMSPVPTALIETVMPLNAGDVRAFAA